MENKYISESKSALLSIYNRFPVVFEKGEGVYLYDTEGKKYLDFAAGIAVSSLGYKNSELNEAMKSQIDSLMHISNLYYNTACGKAANALSRASEMDRIFFTNSGAEAVEGALKAARKYAHSKNEGRYEFVAMEHSFHGRTLGAVSVTGKEAYRKPFEPLIGGVKFAVFNDIDSVKTSITEKTCAVILEPVQGEGGIYPADRAFLEAVRSICDEQDILLIFDEIQCGMGRTGSMFAWQGYGVKPDIIVMAKAIGNGVPVGAFGMTEKVAENSLAPGDHGTTYGGNPFVCAAVSKVLEIFEKENIVSHVNDVSSYLEQRLDELAEESEHVVKRRGKGLIQGIVVTKPPARVIEKALENGLVVISAGSDVIRLVPPLIITNEHVDEMIEKLKKALS